MIDIVRAWRVLGRKPGFLCLVVATLGIGIGSATTVLMIANELFLRPIPGVSYTTSAAYLEFHSIERPEMGPRGIPGPAFDDLRRSVPQLVGLAAYSEFTAHIRIGEERPREVVGVTIAGDYFEVLGVQAEMGRVLAQDQTGPDADPNVVVISEQLWESLYSRAPDVIGRTLMVNRARATVIGVAGNDFRGPERARAVDVFAPTSAQVAFLGLRPDRLWATDQPAHRSYIARAELGMAPGTVGSHIEAAWAAIAAEEGSPEYLADLRPSLTPSLRTTPALRRLTLATLSVLGGAAALLLLVACTNVGSLMLVRAVELEQRDAISRTFGASVSRLLWSHLGDAFVLSVLGSLFGLLVASFTWNVVEGNQLWALPRFATFSLDVRVWAFLSVAVMAATLFFGFLPWLLTSRGTIKIAIRSAGDTHATGRMNKRRAMLCSAQVALSLILIVGTMLLYRSLRNLRDVDLGFALENVLAVPVNELPLAYERQALRELDDRLLTSVAAVPGVAAAALDVYGPLSSRFTAPVRSSADASSGTPGIQATLAWVTSGWRETLGADISTGRFFLAPDLEADAPRTVIVTESLAKRLFGTEDALGRRIFISPRDSIGAVVIGVLRDLRLMGPRAEQEHVVLLPYGQRELWGFVTVLVRVAEGRAVSDVTNRVTEAVGAVLPELPLPQATSLTERFDLRVAEEQILGRLIAMFGVMAIILSAVGLYGVVASTVASRRREFAIRLAVGADGPRLARLVLRLVTTILGPGAVVGLIGAYHLSRLLEGRLFGVEVPDLASFGGGFLVIALTALLACLGPAVVAAKVDAVTTLRLD